MSANRTCVTIVVLVLLLTHISFGNRNHRWPSEISDLQILFPNDRTGADVFVDVPTGRSLNSNPASSLLFAEEQSEKQFYSVHLPTSPDDALILWPSEELLDRVNTILPVYCPWIQSACPLNQFGVQVSIKSRKNTETHHILQIVTRKSATSNELSALRFVLRPRASLVIQWGGIDHEHEQLDVITSETVRLIEDELNSLRVTVKLNTGEVNYQLWSPTLTVSSSFNETVPALIPDVGLLRRNRRNMESLLHEIPMNMIKKVSAMNFDSESFVRYDFRNRLIKTAPREALTIEFELPSGVENGLIWFSENSVSKSFVYLKDSRLHYTYVFVDRTGSAQLTLTEEIYLNTPLVPNTPQILSLIRTKENLTLTLNERSHASKAIDGRVPLVPSDGDAYLGGTAHPSGDTEGKITESFRGRITKAEVVREGDKKVDLLQVATDPHWETSVKKTGDVKFEYKEPKVRLVISPTASKPFRSAWSTTGDKLAWALMRDPIPIYFMGTQTSVVRFDTWDFTVYRSFEIEFSTYEPNGILFFVGPDREHTDFVCVELFDGNVYFAYAVGDHYRHIQLNPPNYKVNTGMSNRVYVSRNEQHRFLVKFNDRVVDLDQGTEAHQTEFATYTYIGSVDQPSRLPWHVWSRENFAGCISSIRVNDDKFLDPTSRMSQHTDVSRGVQYGKCHVLDRKCTRTLCGGGQCAERSYPFFGDKNFACDCSASDKTFREKVEDIRRSETCNRMAPILEMDGEMVLLIDFERQENTLTTHTDDISLQFKTQQSTVPLFYAVSPSDKSYFRVDLVGGQIRVQTNINHLDNRIRMEEYFLTSSPLNNNQWHTLRIRRRAEHLEISVDGLYDDTGKIPLQHHLNTFKLVAQQIYLGSAGPSDFSRPPPPTSETRFLPPAPRFVGEFRNFYWNEYDFIGTGSVPNKYITNMLTPRAVLPTFPQWPRKPLYSITLTRRLHFGRFEKVIDIQQGGDMLLIEFKTYYEGILLSAREAGALDQVQITLALLRGRLHVIYSIYGQSGVHQLVGGDKLDDGQWHRIALGLDRRKKQLIAYLDSYPSETIGNTLALNKIKHLNFYFGGLPDADWQAVLALIRTHSPASLHGSEAEQGKQPALTGCLGGFSLRADDFVTDLLDQYRSQLIAYPPDEIIRGDCRDQRRCHVSYCQHGRCEQTSDTEVRCICTGTGYEGPRCEIKITECPPGYCSGRGRCSMIGNQPKCDCSGTGYHGLRCELNPCSVAGYCQNGGVCIMRGSMPYCECRGTGYTGDKCQDVICPAGYCLNHGRCRVDANDKPVCDCQGTGYMGARCDQPACTAETCANGGRCLVNTYGIVECNCAGTGYTGPHCRTPICTFDYCSNGGRCIVGPNDQARCECRGTGYTGDRCSVPICTDGYCSNRGRCTIGPNDQPVCNCYGTGFSGPRCTEPACRPGLCQNGGRCVVDSSGQPKCECDGTGFVGTRCQTPICSPGYCMHGGRCTVGSGNQPTCDCAGSGHRGNRCEEPICPVGYCLHGGQCRVNEAGQPVCDCTLTNYQGERCETPICHASYCGGRGLCVVRQRQPTCDCHSGYHGARCEIEVCPENYCINGGFCSPGPDKRPVCTCPVNYEGDRCHLPKVCPPDYCFHGGRCSMNRGVPQCDCLGTDYTGPRCEVPQTCPVGFCQNGGRCSVQKGAYVCDCTGTGFRGIICNEPEACPPNYCLYGGVCSVLPGNRYVCDCSRTGRSGDQCNENSNGIYVPYEKDGYLLYPLIPAVRTLDDNVTLGFRTYMQSGTLVTFLTPDGRYWAIKLRDGRILVDVDGKNQYASQTRSNDGHYHVLNIERRGDTMIVTQDTEVISVRLSPMVNPADKSLTYNAIHVAADEKKSNIFRGVIGGFYWNGRYPLDDLKAGRVTHTGDLTIVLAPDFTISPPKPQPVCSLDYCLNRGVCYAENYQLKCDCSNTGWNGVRCERQSRGFVPSEPGNRAYVIYTITPQKRTNTDDMRVAFQTWANNGPIARVIQADSSFYDFVLVDGRPMFSFNGKRYVPISSNIKQFNDGQMHVITLKRSGKQFNVTVDGHVTHHDGSGLVNSDNTLVSREIVLGADKQLEQTFDGVIGAFYWNGRYLVNERGALVSDASVMIGPGRQPAQNMDEVVVVLMPHLLTPSTTYRPGPPKPLPDGIPEGSIAGGVVMPGLGTGNVDMGAPIISPGNVIGGGGAGLNAGTGLMLKQAGGLLGMGGLVDALLAGLLLALLLLISALIWACWRCKPGCCAVCYGKSGGKGRGSAWDRMVAKCCAPPSGTGKESVGLLENGLDVPDTMISPTYTATSRPDLQTGIDSPLITGAHIEQPLPITDQNIYNIDGLKVDCVLITKNSKYFVTGSSMGPPKVWDAQSGEVYKIMEGNELGCTDLHLACDDTVLVTQVVDDLGGGLDTLSDRNVVRVKRLQLWDFASGHQLEMPVEVMCTATCLTRKSEHVIVARSNRNYPSIVAWNLPANHIDIEIFYETANPMIRDNVSYLNISHDDRLIVAGCQVEEQACYMVFDLAAHFPVPYQPRIISFDAEVNATEILGREIAVTGTRRGELLVWNLHTGEVIRQIQINATLEGGNLTALPPHTGIIHCVKLSEDERYLVTGAQDQLVRVWSMPEERLLHTLEGHADDVLSVAISRDSEIVVSGSWDGSIRVWRLRDGNQICWFSSNIEILQVKISNDKRSIVALGERNEHRKLITLRVVRNRVRTTTSVRPAGSRVSSSMSPPTPGMGPSSPNAIA